MLALLEKELPQAELLVTSFAYDGAISDSSSTGRSFIPDYQSFLEEWQVSASQQDLLVITGSLYFISEVRRFLVEHQN